MTEVWTAEQAIEARNRALETLAASTDVLERRTAWRNAVVLNQFVRGLNRETVRLESAHRPAGHAHGEARHGREG